MKIPEFAIFLDRRTKVSGIWIKEEGRWRKYLEREFGTVEIIAAMLRESPSPKITLMRLAKVIAKIPEESG